MSPCILSDAVPHSICFVMLLHDASLLPYLLCHIVQFSRCRSPTAFAVRFEDPTFQSGLQIQRQIAWWARVGSNPKANRLVGPSGLEPPTLRLSVVRSSQLSYGPSSSQSPLAAVSGFAENFSRSLAPPLRFKPASLGFETIGLRGLRLFSWWR